MTKFVTFEVSGDITRFSLILEHSESGQQETMTFNPHAFTCEEGDKYVYMFRCQGELGDKYKIEISGASQAATPIERAISSPSKVDDYGDELIA